MRIAFSQFVDPEGALELETINPEEPVVLAASATLAPQSQRASNSPVTVGDVVVLRAGTELETASRVSWLVFRIPDAVVIDEAVPAWIRPDWDPSITDTPGGCATEEGAYRRILLTWLKDNGPYTFEGLNAHRGAHHRLVHPTTTRRTEGFDEFYLVQRSRPGAVLLTSDQTERIEAAGSDGESPSARRRAFAACGNTACRGRLDLSASRYGAIVALAARWFR